MKGANILVGVLVITGSLMFPQIVEAQGELVPGGLVPCDTGCTLCDGFILLKNIYTFLLGFLASVGVFAFVAGGLIILTARANTQQVQRGKEVITNAIIGIVLVAGSFLILNAIVFIFLEQNDRDARGNLEGSFIDAGSAFEIISGQGLVVNNCDTANRFQPRGDDPVSGGPPSSGSGGGPPSSGSGGGPVGDLPEGAEGIACLAASDQIDSPKLRALMRTITGSTYEGVPKAEDYTTLVCGVSCPNGGPECTSPPPSIHPSCITGTGQLAELSRSVNGGCLNRPPGDGSTAYGRFQIIDSTWNGWAGAAGISTVSGANCIAQGGSPAYDMSAKKQDIAVAEFLKRNGVLSDLSDTSAALNNQALCQWASVPSTTGCNVRRDEGSGPPAFRALYQELLEEERNGKCTGDSSDSSNN